MDHHRIGAILGFPDCCVEQWTKEFPGGGQARRRGVIKFTRTPVETQAIRDKLSGFLVADHVERILHGSGVYVPCDLHVGSNGWEQ